MKQAKELTPEEMAAVSGGTQEEAQAFLNEMAKKYGVTNPTLLLTKMTPDEIATMQNLLKS